MAAAAAAISDDRITICSDGRNGRTPKFQKRQKIEKIQKLKLTSKKKFRERATGVERVGTGTGTGTGTGAHVAGESDPREQQRDEQKCKF